MTQKNLFGPTEKIVVFDIETQRSFQDVGGRKNLHMLRVSIAVLYDYNSAGFSTYTEDMVSDLVDELLASTKVIGYNIKGFDYPVLSPYRPDVNFARIPTLDLLEEIRLSLGFRIGLDNVARATLDKGKSADGLDALRWFKEGRMDLIEKYCRDDVDVTRRVYEFGRDNGYLKFRDRRGELQTVSIHWK